MFRPQPYDPAVGRRWLILCATLGVLASVVAVLAASDTVTAWLLYPCLVWFALAILGSLLYGLGGVLAAPAPPADLRLYTAQRFHEQHLLNEMGDRGHNETIGLVMTVFGTVPETLEEGGHLGEEWKLSLNEGHWLIVTRVR